MMLSDASPASYHVSYIIYHIMDHVSYIIHHVSYIMYNVSCIIHNVSYIMYNVSCIIIMLSGFRCLCYEGYEADDVMASLSSWSRGRGLNVVHISNDKGDYASLSEDCQSIDDY